MGKYKTAEPRCRPDFRPNYGKNGRIVVRLNKIPVRTLPTRPGPLYLRASAARPVRAALTRQFRKPMLFVDMLFVMAVAISFIPILTGYCAHSRGRSFWLWFTLGWVLPFASFFLLFALIARDELDPGRRLLGEARQILRDAEANAKVVKES
jgi:hypothetical protein